MGGSSYEVLATTPSIRMALEGAERYQARGVVERMHWQLQLVVVLLQLLLVGRAWTECSASSGEGAAPHTETEVSPKGYFFRRGDATLISRKISCASTHLGAPRQRQSSRVASTVKIFTN